MSRNLGYIGIGIVIGVFIWPILVGIGLLALGAFLFKLYETSKETKS